MREINITWSYYSDSMSITYSIYNDIEILMNQFSHTDGGITEGGVLDFVNVITVIFSNMYARSYTNEEQEIREITNFLINKVYNQNQHFFEDDLKNVFEGKHSIGFSQAKNLLSRFLLPKM